MYRSWGLALMGLGSARPCSMARALLKALHPTRPPLCSRQWSRLHAGAERDIPERHHPAAGDRALARRGRHRGRGHAALCRFRCRGRDLFHRQFCQGHSGDPDRRPAARAWTSLYARAEAVLGFCARGEACGVSALADQPKAAGRERRDAARHSRNRSRKRRVSEGLSFRARYLQSRATGPAGGQLSSRR